MDNKSEIVKVRCEYKENPIGLDVKSPRFSWQIYSEKNEVFQIRYRIIAASAKENVQNGIGDMWDSGFVEGRETAQVVYQGKRLDSRQQVYYRIFSVLNTGESLESQMQSFEMGLMHRRDFIGRMIKYRPEEPVKSRKGEFSEGTALPLLRKCFTVNKEVERARLYSTALGLYSQKINGLGICKDRLLPGWSQYDRMLQYQTYDITPFITEGENCISVVLADGWYAGCIGLFGREYYGAPPMSYYGQLEIYYRDGTKDIIVSDKSWKYRFGPWRYADLMLGEYYDAQKEIDGWETALFDDSGWAYAEEYLHSTSLFHGDFAAQINPPVRIMEEIKPVSVTKTGDSSYVVDMGQNMVGITRLKIRGTRGQKIIQRFGEMLNQDGSLYTDNLRLARAEDTYICKGAGAEIMEPQFTFHGFRYVEVKGIEALECEDITGLVLYSAMDITGHITTGDELVNKLFQNVMWSNKGNFIDVPTDCPQRDERLGWTGDANVFCRTACYNMDAASFFTKWLMDVAHSQRMDGSFSDVAPYVNLSGTAVKHTGNADSGNAVWADAGIFIPWALYEAYGDSSLLVQHYHGMERYMAFLADEAEDGIRADRGYGDWLSVGENTNNALVATAFYYRDAVLMSKISGVLGKKAEEEKYGQLSRMIKTAFTNKFINENTGEVMGDTQTGYLLTLAFKIAGSGLVQKLAERLVQNIKAHGTHLTSGFVGVSYLLPVLTANGYTELAYDLLLQKSYPAWLYPVVNGATTIWERWNSYTREDGFGDVGMNSFNHYSLGAVAEWMYAWMGGIRTENRGGFGNFVIAPCTDERIKMAEAFYDSMAGRIGSRWEYKGDIVEYTVHVPANAEAELKIRQGGGIVHTNISRKKLKEQDGYITARLHSGDYVISIEKG